MAQRALVPLWWQRIWVKNSFKSNPALRIITRKPLVADEAEEASNSRSRSAKLRVSEKLLGHE
ncbi:MAG: 16S rRNA (cytosine(1402)-N(4))-methyltransferase [Synechococcaceae bacterium WB8_1B_057]|nr:16S rRNA (cytosine(1402)-N(4))-methyltransferase [Synechococcaceae bacterium WB8_1B_057]